MSSSFKRTQSCATTLDDMVLGSYQNHLELYENRGSRITTVLITRRRKKTKKQKKGDILTTFGTLEYSTKVCVNLTANATASVTLHEMMGCYVIFCKIVIKGGVLVEASIPDEDPIGNRVGLNYDMFGINSAKGRRSEHVKWAVMEDFPDICKWPTHNTIPRMSFTR